MRLASCCSSGSADAVDPFGVEAKSDDSGTMAGTSFSACDLAESATAAACVASRADASTGVLSFVGCGSGDFPGDGGGNVAAVLAATGDVGLARSVVLRPGSSHCTGDGSARRGVA